MRAPGNRLLKCGAVAYRQCGQLSEQLAQVQASRPAKKSPPCRQVLAAASLCRAISFFTWTHIVALARQVHTVAIRLERKTRASSPHAEAPETCGTGSHWVRHTSTWTPLCDKRRGCGPATV